MSYPNAQKNVLFLAHLVWRATRGGQLELFESQILVNGSDAHSRSSVLFELISYECLEVVQIAARLWIILQLKLIYSIPSSQMVAITYIPFHLLTSRLY